MPGPRAGAATREPFHEHVEIDVHENRGVDRWYAVDIRLERKLPREVTLPEMRTEKGLDGMVLLRKGSRLSVQPVSSAEWKTVLAMARRKI